MFADDFNKLRMISRRLTRTNFQEPWQWRVGIVPPKGFKSKYTYDLFTIKSGVSDFDLLAKAIDYDPVTIETESVKAGTIVFNFPTAATTTTINLTMRDSLDSKGLPRFYRFFSNVASLVCNRDGTVNVPNYYLMTINLYSLVNDEKKLESYRVFPQKLGNWSASVDGQELVEYPVTFIQFRSF